MALKVLMLKRKLDEKKKMLEAAQAKAEELNTREAELEADIEAAETDEEKEAVEEAVAEFETEKGANEDERTALEKEVAGLEAELAEEERKQKEAAEKREEEVPSMEGKDLIKAQRDAFANAIRGMEKRTDPTDYNMAKGNNGDIIPKTIADEIITKIANISPIFEKAHKYPVKGNLSIPFYPASSAHVITAAYATEFTDLLANSGDFDSVDLTGYLAGALAKIGRTLINNTDVDVVPFVEDQMAEAFKAFVDQEAINGSANKADGMLAGITQLVTGTYKYQGRWQMLDQCIVSGSLLDTAGRVYTSPTDLHIWAPPFLLEEDSDDLQQTPRRTYNGYRYNGGFSDHLPIFIDLTVRF